MELTKSLIDRAVKVCGSQAKLAARLGVTRPMITLWMQGNGSPSELHMGKMAQIAGVRIEDALMAKARDALAKSEEGRALLREMDAGFLGGVAAIFSTFATPEADEGTAGSVKRRLTFYASYLLRGWSLLFAPYPRPTACAGNKPAPGTVRLTWTQNIRLSGA